MMGKLTFTIDKDVPLPLARMGVGFHAIDAMEVGDSIFINSGKSQAVLSSHFRTLAKARPGWKFVTRRVVENGVAGIRVWRVS